MDCIQTSKDWSLTERYTEIDKQLSAIITKHTPSEAALESLFFFKNITTAMHVSEARGVILSSLLRHQVTCFEYTPLQVKQSVTGYGRADKSAVERMVEMQLGSQMKELKKPKLLDDTLDAIAVALTHGASRKLQTAI
jgi:crossover junction endodeoxyribonuclease RuvC